jgi:predicted neuraminidase
MTKFLLAAFLLADPQSQTGVVRSEFIFTDAPFTACHASTIVQTRKGALLAAWFGGSREGARDVGIWLARRGENEWSKPTQVAEGKASDGKPQPCWNPVLFQPKDGPLMLFYKVGASPRTWHGMLTTSDDDGATWAPARPLPDGFLGPIKDKPVQLSDGAVLCPSSTEDDGWRVHFERSDDRGRDWSKTDPLNDGKTIEAIQPTILSHADGRLQALGRSRQGKVWQAWSKDGGKTWGAMEFTELPNPNSGIDALTLADGRQLLVYNHTAKDRSPLNVAVSEDGRTWKSALVLETDPGEYSYPAVIQDRDGLVHITYTWKRRRIKHVVVDPRKLMLIDLPAP